MKKLYTLITISFLAISSYAQSPPDIPFLSNFGDTVIVGPADTVFMNWDFDPINPGIQFATDMRTNVTKIAAGFDNGRRQEELVFSLPLNSLGTLAMPTQVIWDAMSYDERVLHLLNEERIARAGADYGYGPVKGRPLTGIELSFDNLIGVLTQNYLNTGSLSNPTSFNDLLDMDPVVGGSGCMNNALPQIDCCHELLAPNDSTLTSNQLATPLKAYSIGSDVGTISPGIAVRFIYDNVFRFPKRLRLLIQDEDLNSATPSEFGLDDNYGASGEEGFLGVGLATGFFAGGSQHRTAMIVAIMDPIPESEGCNYNCTTCTPCPPIFTENRNPIPSAVYQAVTWVQSGGTVPSGGDVTMKATNYVQLNQQFEVSQGGVFHAYIDECFFTLN